MAHSQNGWPVIDKDDCDQGPFHGARFPNGIRRGDAATIARWQLERYAATVEPIIAGTCWGWYVKKIIGSDDYSNHSSGTAWDINAEQNAMGVPTSRSMTPHQIEACHDIERASDGVLRWGGDFTRPDPMHWEIVGTMAEAAAFARQIREAEDKMATLDADDRKYLENLLAPTTKALRAGLTSDTVIRSAMLDLVRQGSREAGLDVLWLAVWAKRHQASLAAGGPGDPTYLDLLDADKTRARNAWDLMQELGLTPLPDPAPGGTT